MYDDDEEISNLYELFPELEGYDPELNVDWLNELRRKVWREILIAIPIITAQLILYSVTTEVFWFALIGPTLVWLFLKARELGNINSTLTSLEVAEGIALRTELSVATKMMLVFGVPIAVVAVILAANTYDPELLGIDNESLSEQTQSPYFPELLGTVKLSSEQQAEATWQTSAGVSVWLPEECDLLVVDWHTENRQEEEMSYFTQVFAYPGSLEIKTLIIGTDNQLSDRESILIADTVECFASTID
jgi:hypothetical protein